MKLKYSSYENFMLGGATTSNKYQVFSGNNLWRVRDTTGSASPNYFDKWALLYRKYYVAGAKISVTAVQNDAYGSVTGMSLATVPVVRNDNPDVTIDNALDAMDVSGAKVRTGYHKLYISDYKTTKGMFGQKTSQDNLYTAAVDAAPDQQWYWAIFLRNNYDTVENDYYLLVKMTFYVRFYKRKLLDDEKD